MMKRLTPGPASPPQQPARDPNVKRLRLLYVEDEDINWEVTQVHLRSRYDIERARNSREAFEMLRSQLFHAVLMDIQLKDSDIDGIGITRIIRGRFTGSPPDYAQDFPPSSMPILFMTAYSARYSKDQILDVGGDDLITKPIDFTLLGLSLSRVLLRNWK